MQTFLKFIISILIFAATPVQAIDIVAGAEIAKSCGACHGAEGISSEGIYPHLAGQKAAYLIKQLRAFRDKKRTDIVMNATASQLSNAEINDVAAFYASLKLDVSENVTPANPKIAAKAAMCLGCHGSQGQGRGSFPRLANQQPEYLATQLKAFKTRKRLGGPMNPISNNFSDQEIVELSIYFSRLNISKKP